MEPLRGGSILNNTPKEVLSVINAYPEKRSLAEWCFCWLYNMPEVSVVLSGTSTMEQLKDNLRIFEIARSNVMSKNEMELIHTIRAIYKTKMSIGCTGCKYCMPCPQGINIPEIFKHYNGFYLLNRPRGDALLYKGNMVDTGFGADKCVECNVCMEHCPQSLAIPELLKKVHKEFIEALPQ
jgi:predicted aldo/keto reductase-like oxidoreductase